MKLLGGRLGGAHFDAEAAKAMLVRRRQGDEGHVYRQVAIAEQAGDFVEKDGREIGAPFLDSLPYVVADE